MTTERAKGMPRKPRDQRAAAADEGEALLAAVRRALVGLGAALALPAPDLRSAACAEGVLSLRRGDGGLVAGALTAPRGLVVSLWDATPGLEQRVWSVPRGRWDPVRTALQCDDAAQQAWLALAAMLLARGEREEAQLVWLQAESLETVDRRSAAFKALFPRLPAAAAITQASSAAAYLVRIGAFVEAPAVIDRFIAAEAFLDHIAEALGDSSGKRQRDLADLCARAAAAFAAQPEPCLRELARLLHLHLEDLRALRA